MDKIASAMSREIDVCWSIFESENANKLCAIHKVPQHIREVDVNAYEPIVLSIGPYHHGTENLIAMEKEKWKSLDCILKLNCQVGLQDYLRAIFKIENETRNCYSDAITMNRKKLLQMILLDTCFILVKVDGTVISAARGINQEDINEKAEECVNSGQKIEARGNDVEATANRSESDHDIQHQYPDGNVGDWYSVFAWHDLFLLENQIPFFVVEKIYGLVVSNGMTKAILMEQLVVCIEDILRQFPRGVYSDRPKSCDHLLHLCHMYFRPTQQLVTSHQPQPNHRYFHRLVHFGYKYSIFGSKTNESEHNLLPVQQSGNRSFQAGQQHGRWRQATQYHEAGIQFKRRQYRNDDKHSLLDIKFASGMIEVPFFPIDENTGSLFKNLIALEQTDPRYGNDVTAYIAFMSQIVATPADAALLSQNGIIVHMLDSDDEVSALFVSLTKDVYFKFEGNYYLKSLCSTLEIHYQSRVNRWIAWLRQNHLSNPWLVLALLAAVTVLLCTIVQTIYTVLSYEDASAH
ncbi:unnamed protein product [Urochloa decumbens]|uniref:Uncharacterized protein n=1 Tax=Urochloa decumbens TaxID=240449 RepID=A0ABC9CRZ0_9POAL